MGFGIVDLGKGTLWRDRPYALKHKFSARSWQDKRQEKWKIYLGEEKEKDGKGDHQSSDANEKFIFLEVLI